MEYHDHCPPFREGVAAPLEPSGPEILTFKGLNFAQWAYIIVHPLKRLDHGFKSVQQFLRELCEAYAAAVSKNLHQELASIGIRYCDEIADEGTPWECPAEPEPQYFATLREALRFRDKLTESRILELEKEITALRLELRDRDKQVKSLTEDAVRLIEQAGKSPR